jgi:hypothetical protein
VIRVSTTETRTHQRESNAREWVHAEHLEHMHVAVAAPYQHELLHHLRASDRVAPPTHATSPTHESSRRNR